MEQRTEKKRKSGPDKALQNMAKRWLDFVAAILLLLLLFPLLLFLLFAVWFQLGRPVIFTQQRPGLHGKLFSLYKFRSMTNECDKEGRLLPPDQRLTTLGRFLRTTSLDELPELLNIAKGDMSFVGPRPLLAEYLPLYSPGQARRHEVRPGLTGLAQVNGRNNLTWEEKFRLDVWYIDNWNLCLDAKILFLTLIKVFSCQGISPPGKATMNKFTGSVDETFEKDKNYS